MCSFQTNGSSLDYCITDLGDKYCQNTRMALTLIINKSIPKITVKEIFFFFLRYKFVCDEVQKIFALASTVTLMSVGSHREMKTNNYYGGFA